MAATSKKTASAKKEASLRPKLHLSSLKIENFRGLKSLEIPRLGRVTLLAGKNGTGKTTVLEAVRLYAARGKPSEITNILSHRDEIKMGKDEDNDAIAAPNWEGLFFGRNIPSSDADALVVGPMSSRDTLKIIGASLDGEDVKKLLQTGLPNASEVPNTALEISFGKNKYKIPIWSGDDFSFRRAFYSMGSYWDRFSGIADSLQAKCLPLGPNVPTNDFIAGLWEMVVMNNQDKGMLKALALAARQGGELERVIFLGSQSSPYPRFPDNNRGRFVVKIENHKTPLPLKSLGDGAFRLFAVALALVNARNGFLVIDEVENGLHHSIQYDFWKMVLQTARDNNVQVLATTHGWSCVEGFARAANDLQDIEGVLARIERKGDKTRSVEYNEKDLKIAAEQGIEVR